MDSTGSAWAGSSLSLIHICYEVFLECLKADPETADWEVIDKVGQGTAQEQLAAVEDFITAGVDAIVVVQNSPEITAECITKANEAGIPYFALTHAPSVPAGGELAGFVGYDFVETGVMAGEDALTYNNGEGVKKLVMVEGKLGQGTASAQSLSLIHIYLKDDLKEAVSQAISKLKGSYALGVICERFPDEIVAVRKDSPLVVGVGKNENLIASDIPAILEYTRDVYFLNNGEIAVVKKDEVMLYDEVLNPVNRDMFTVEWDVSQAEKAGYPHFMLKAVSYTHLDVYKRQAFGGS